MKVNLSELIWSIVIKALVHATPGTVHFRLPRSLPETEQLCLETYLFSH